MVLRKSTSQLNEASKNSILEILKVELREDDGTSLVENRYVS